MQTKIIFLILLMTLPTFGKTSLQKANSKLSTDIKFDGQLVGGKIQSPFEALTVVENEKGIDDLIGVRAQFADRSQKSKGMR